MSLEIQAEFNGTVFVPDGPVDLPVGAKVNLSVTPPLPKFEKRVSVGPPPPITEEHKKIWEQIQKELSENPPPWETLEECMRATRGPSWS